MTVFPTLLKCMDPKVTMPPLGAQWLSGRVLDSRPRGRGFELQQRHCVVSLRKNINPSLVLVQPRKTRPFITERLLTARKDQIKQTKQCLLEDFRLSIDFLGCEK